MKTVIYARVSSKEQKQEGYRCSGVDYGISAALCGYGVFGYRESITGYYRLQYQQYSYYKD